MTSIDYLDKIGAIAKYGSAAFLVTLLLGISNPLLWAVGVGALVSTTKETYLKKAIEMYARFAQLKDFFGIVDDSPITKDHWLYAKKFYIKEAKINNNMDEFFAQVPDKNLDNFLKIMNSQGI